MLSSIRASDPATLDAHSVWSDANDILLGGHVVTKTTTSTTSSSSTLAVLLLVIPYVSDGLIKGPVVLLPKHNLTVTLAHKDADISSGTICMQSMCRVSAYCQRKERGWQSWA